MILTYNARHHNNEEEGGYEAEHEEVGEVRLLPPVDLLKDGLPPPLFVRSVVIRVPQGPIEHGVEWVASIGVYVRVSKRRDYRLLILSSLAAIRNLSLIHI